MSCVSVSTEVVYTQRKSCDRVRNEYSIDLWREVRRRWLVLGVLAAVAAAAVWPRGGAPGGNYCNCMLASPLRTEYLVHLPLWGTYYLSGRRARRGAAGASARPALPVLALGCAHAHAVAPALSAAAVEAFRGAGLHHRLVSGMVVSSVGGPCVWLALGACGAGSTARAGTLLAASYAASLLAAPVSMIILCGRATVPPLGGILLTTLGTLAPFALGALRPAGAASTATAASCRACALLVLYVECCARLAAAEGALHVQDVLATMLLVVSYVCGSAGACWLYARCGLVRPEDARLLALTAVPKCLDVGWESSTACTPAGLSLLPAAFLAPAQALLLAVLADPDDDGADDEGQGRSVDGYQSLPQ